MVRIMLVFWIVFLAYFSGHAQNFINPGGPVESRFLEIKDSVNTNDTLVFFSHYPGEDSYYGVVLFKHAKVLKRKQITYYADEKKTIETNWILEENDSTLQKLRRAIPFSANRKNFLGVMVTHEKSQYVLNVYVKNEVVDTFEVNEPNVGANFWNPNINLIRALRDTSLFVPSAPPIYYYTKRTWYGKKKYYQLIEDKWVEVPHPFKNE